MADGSPLPSWLEWRSSSLIQGRVPADIENLDLMIKQTLADGQTIINKWRVKTLTGEIINLGDRRTELPASPTRLADQSFSDENVDLLHRALDAAE